MAKANSNSSFLRVIPSKHGSAHPLLITSKFNSKDPLSSNIPINLDQHFPFISMKNTLITPAFLFNGDKWYNAANLSLDSLL